MLKQVAKAIGKEKSDLVLKNGKVIDVFCHRIIECDVAISDGVIVGLGEYQGCREIDLGGRYIAPSFIDTHLHIESSMLCPAEYAKLAAAKGVTTLIADPHEIANVCGEAGLAFMFDSARAVPVDILYMLPSCVPATPFDHAGAVIDGQATRHLMQKYPFYGLGELMNSPGVLAADPDIDQKLSCADRVDGHAPLLSGRQLCAYAGSGIKTDHECITARELTEKVSMGMYVQIREGSQAKNLESLLPGLTPHTLRRLLFCSDDRHLGDLMAEGSISYCIAKAVSLGADPLDVITIATLNAAECYGLKGKGAVAPGYRADLVVLGDLEKFTAELVYKDGILIAQDGQALFSADQNAIPSAVTHTVHLPELRCEDFEFHFIAGQSVIEVFADTLYTRRDRAQTAEGLNYLAVIQRHNGSAEMGKGFVQGFGLKGGAIAQSIGHDSHNITVIGDHPRDMALAVNALGRDGGMSVVVRGELAAALPLPIAGLMTDLPAAQVQSSYMQLEQAARQIVNTPGIEPFMLLGFLSLPVLPDIRLTDQGLFDVLLQKFLPTGD